MNEMKQTAVEWLADQLEKHYSDYNIKNSIAFMLAKRKEQEQMIEILDQMIKRENEILGDLHRNKTLQREQHANNKYCLSIVKSLLERK